MLALIPLLCSIVPAIAGLFGGSKAGDTVTAALDTVRQVTGIDATTADGVAQVEALLSGDPAKAEALRAGIDAVRLQMLAEQNRERDAERQAMLDTLRAALADTADARAMARTTGPTAWGAPVISVLILTAFGVMLYRVLSPGVGDAANSTEATLLLGTLATMAGAVANFWLGSSAGSQAKTDALAAIKR